MSEETESPEYTDESEQTDTETQTAMTDVGPEKVFPEFTTPEEVNATLLSLPRLIGLSIDKLLWRRKEAKKALRELREREAKLYNDARFGKDRRHTKDDAIALYPADPVWMRLKRISDLADAKVEYYENRVRMLKETGYALRVYVEHQFYLAGEGKSLKGRRG